MKLAYQTNTWGGVVGHPVGVTSIKDLFYLANGSTADAVRDVADAGYEGVELFDGNVVEYAASPGRLAELLKEHEQRLVGVYSGANFIFPDVLDQELWRIEHAAALAAPLGAEHLVVGGGAQALQPPDEATYARLGDALEQVVQIADRYGLTASLHPHMSTIVETPEQIRRVLDHTSIRLCPDTGHVILGGGDPAQLIEEHGDRIHYVHLKDIDPATGAFVPLGEGSLALEAVMASLDRIGYDGWITVELDSWHDPFAGAARGRRALEPWFPSVESDT